MRTTNWHDLSIYVGKVVESINEIYEPHREMMKFLKELEIVCKFLHKHGKELPLDVHKQMKRAILKDIENEALLDEIFTDFAQQLQIPIVKGFKFTHNKTKDTIPVGTKATLNADNGEIKLIEKYLR